MQRNILTLVVSILIGIHFSFGQSNLHCDVKKVKALNDSINHLSTQIVLDFLKTFSLTCKNNVEYSEWSNESLFLLLEKGPDIFVKVYTTSNEIDRNSIIMEIQNPIEDIPLQRIYSDLKRINVQSGYLENIFSALKVAARKNNIELKL